MDCDGFIRNFDWALRGWAFIVRGWNFSGCRENGNLGNPGKRVGLYREG